MMTLSLCSHRMLQANYLLYTAVTLDLSHFNMRLEFTFHHIFIFQLWYFNTKLYWVKSTVEQPNTHGPSEAPSVSVVCVFFFSCLGIYFLWIIKMLKQSLEFEPIKFDTGWCHWCVWPRPLLQPNDLWLCGVCLLSRLSTKFTAHI